MIDFADFPYRAYTAEDFEHIKIEKPTAYCYIPDEDEADEAKQEETQTVFFCQPETEYHYEEACGWAYEEPETVSSSNKNKYDNNNSYDCFNQIDPNRVNWSTYDINRLRF